MLIWKWKIQIYLNKPKKRINKKKIVNGDEQHGKSHVQKIKKQNSTTITFTYITKNVVVCGSNTCFI